MLFSYVRGFGIFGVLAFCIGGSQPLAQGGTWKSIFDPANPTGWKKIGQGSWTYSAADSALIGKTKIADDFGHMITETEYGDFKARVIYKAIKGNSGFYFRVEEKGFSGVSGFQAEIDPRVDAGGLYETNGRNWVVKPTAAQHALWFKPNAWNEMVVETKGTYVKVTLNGFVSAELRDDKPGRLKGKFALQLHGNQDVEVLFRSVSLWDSSTTVTLAPKKLDRNDASLSKLRNTSTARFLLDGRTAHYFINVFTTWAPVPVRNRIR